MATLEHMLAKYGQRETARIMQYEGFPVSQPRISEALKPRRGRSEATSEARYYELQGYAKQINLSKYPKGVPESEAVVSYDTIAPPVYQYPPRRGKKHVGHATVTQIRAGKVMYVEVGNAPHKGHDDSIVWEKPRQVIPEISLRKWLETAERRFGKNAKVSIRIFGVFDYNFGRYLASQRFQGFKEDFYVHHETMGTLRVALDAVEAVTKREVATYSKPKDKKLAREGNLANPEEYAGYTARWATAWAPFRYIEVNHLSIWIDRG